MFYYMEALKNSNMSYPTWEKISKMLGIANVDPKTFGVEPLRKGNDPFYSVIKNNKVETPCGVDIPILLEPSSNPNGRLIIILGESALRSENELNKITAPYDVILGTPYALHLSKTPPKCGVYWKIFNTLLEKGYSLYITDIIKVWWKDKKLVPDNLDILIFEEEWKILKERKPVIVAWGKKAENALMKIEEVSNEVILPLPHPSTQSRDSWKLKIFEKAIFDNNVQYARHFYKEPKAPTTEEIVENVALDEILSFAERTSNSSK